MDGWTLSMFALHHIFPLISNHYNKQLSTISIFWWSSFSILLIQPVQYLLDRGVGYCEPLTIQISSWASWTSVDSLQTCKCIFKWLFITTYKGVPHCRVTVLARVPLTCSICKNSIFEFDLISTFLDFPHYLTLPRFLRNYSDFAGPPKKDWGEINWDQVRFKPGLPRPYACSTSRPWRPLILNIILLLRSV